MIQRPQSSRCYYSCTHYVFIGWSIGFAKIRFFMDCPFPLSAFRAKCPKTDNLDILYSSEY